MVRGGSASSKSGILYGSEGDEILRPSVEELRMTICSISLEALRVIRRYYGMKPGGSESVINQRNGTLFEPNTLAATLEHEHRQILLESDK